MAPSGIVKLNGLTDREAVMDAVLRFTWGLDQKDVGLLESAFTQDAVVDLTPMRKLGVPLSETQGRDAIVASMRQGVMDALDTGHVISNWRIQLDGNTATLTAYGTSQHFRRGEGSDLKKNDAAMLLNKYHATVVRGKDDLWRISKISIGNQWSWGTAEVLMGQ